MEKKSILGEKIFDNWGVGDLVCITTYQADDESNHLSYGFVIGAPPAQSQLDMFPSIRIYDINKRIAIDTYFYNLEIISSKE